MRDKVILVVGALFGVYLLASSAIADSSCLSYQSETPYAGNYAPAWDVFDALHRLLISTTCPTSGNDITITVGRGDAHQVVSKNAYAFENGTWHPITLSGTAFADGWLLGSGTASYSAIATTGPMFIAAYACTYMNDAWKCGCRDQTCALSYWQLQAYKGNVPPAGTTGTTGSSGSTSGVTGTVGSTGTTGTGTTGGTTGTTGTSGTTGGGTGGSPIGGPLPEDSFFASATWQAGIGLTRPATPATLSATIGAANPGDTVILAPGNYATITISKSGTAAAPIFIKAENPAVVTNATNGTAVFASAAERSNFIGRMTITGSNLVIDGMYFDPAVGNRGIDFTNAATANVLVRRSHFEEEDFYGVYVWHSGSVRTRHLGFVANFFRNMVVISGNTAKMDYGIAAHDTEDLEAINNVFDGVFNHSMSLKENNVNTKIINNYFKGCGQKCLDIGQSQDGEGNVIDLTGIDALIQGNKFESAYSTLGTSYGRVAAHLRNIRNIQFISNTFVNNKFSSPVQVNFVRQGGALLDNVHSLGLGQHGPVYDDGMVIRGNNFNGGTISLTGRGRGALDVIQLTGNTNLGTTLCTVGVLQDDGVSASYLSSDLDRGKPTIQQSGNSFTCN